MHNAPQVTLIRSDDHDPAAYDWAGIPTDNRFGLRRFPAPGAYHARAAEHLNRAGSSAAVYASAQRDWHVRGQTGCQFARLAARDAAVLRWDHIVATGRPDGIPYPQVAQLVDHAVADPGCELVSVLLPDVTTAAGVVAAVRGLVGAGPAWLERDEVCRGSLRLHLRYPVTSEVRAWVMAFAPAWWLPATRRGPYFELAIRTKPKPAWIYHRLNQDREVAHLADVPLAMSGERWDHRWRTTLARTRMVLAGEPDDISAARATLAIPVHLIRG